MIRWIFTGYPLTLHNLPTRVLTRGTWLRADPPWKLCQSHLMQAGLSSMVVAVWTENKTHFFSKVEPVSFCIKPYGLSSMLVHVTLPISLWILPQCLPYGLSSMSLIKRTRNPKYIAYPSHSVSKPNVCALLV